MVSMNSTTNTTSATETKYQSFSAKSTEKTETNDTTETESTRKSGNYGKTIGDAKLSDEGAKYYEQLKKKYFNCDFILVSADQKANAQANASSYANANKMVVLIDEDKIERMATDEKYREQYEAIISNASSGLSQLKTSIANAGLTNSVKGYGMKVNDGGTASFFAVLKKSSSDQKARIEKKAEQKKAEKKAAEKKAAEKKAKKKEQEERLEKSRKTDDVDEDIDDDTEIDDDTVIITANSIEELMRKISDYAMEDRTNNVQTESEKMIGQNVDYRG
jgi:hypothetical protein